MIKSTGIVRRIDHLGRVVIPSKLRRSMAIEEKDAIEILTDGEKIILRKYAPCCIFCGLVEDLVNYQGKNICSSCLIDLSKQII